MYSSRLTRQRAIATNLQPSLSALCPREKSSTSSPPLLRQPPPPTSSASQSSFTESIRCVSIFFFGHHDYAFLESTQSLDPSLGNKPADLNSSMQRHLNICWADTEYSNLRTSNLIINRRLNSYRQCLNSRRKDPSVDGITRFRIQALRVMLL